MDNLNININNSQSKIDINEFNCVKVQFDELCLYKKWKLVKQNKAFFCAWIDTTDVNCAFSIHRYDTLSSKITLDKYFNEARKVIISDTVEKLDSIAFTELILKNNRAYYGEIKTKIIDKSYTCYTMYIEHGSLIYDFAVKVHSNKKKNIYEIFQSILLYYKVNGKPLVPDNYLLVSINEVIPPSSAEDVKQIK